jgi:hypothetical protein
MAFLSVHVEGHGSRSHGLLFFVCFFMRLSLPTNDENPIYPPRPLAGEGRGEAEAEGDPLASGPLASGYNTMFPLTVSLGDTSRILRCI